MDNIIIKIAYLLSKYFKKSDVGVTLIVFSMANVFLVFFIKFRPSIIEKLFQKNISDFFNTNNDVFVFTFVGGIIILPLIIGFFLIYKKVLREKVYAEFENEFLNETSEGELRDVDIKKRQKLRRAEILLERNLRRNFVLKQVQFQNACIINHVQWQPSPTINVLLGRNGYGKSYFLKLLIGMMSYDNDRLGILVGEMNDKIQMRLDLLQDGKPKIIEHDGVAFEESVGKIPILAIPDTRFINRDSNSITSDEGDYADLSRHGAHHFLYDKPFNATIQSVFAQMCIESIGAQGEDIKYPSSPQLNLMSKIIFELSGEKFVFQRIKAIGSGRFDIIVETEASPGNPISIQKASQGTISIIAIFGLIYQFLQKRFPNISKKDIFEQTAIVLIDEIDAHLHPAWQRKIVKLLRSTFPNVQFFLTAHSPLVVAGCCHGEISVLKRQANKLNLIVYQNDFIGISVEEIYNELFDVGDRDEIFLDYYAELPLIQDLKGKLERERRSKDPNRKWIENTQNHLEKINKIQSKEDQNLELEMLNRENEQLRRQLKSLQKK